MDNLCHTLAGAALGQAGLKRRTALGMPTLLVGANLPDVDVLAIPFGHSLDFRRGWTHGVLALAVLPFLLTAAVLAWDRWVRRRRSPHAPPADARGVLLLSFVSILSHPLLDWLNTYGVRLLMPFSGRWLYGDALFIVDPWVWAALGLGVWLSRRRERSGRSAPRRPARIAAGAVAAYVALMVAMSALSERWVRARVQALGVRPVRSVLASPVPLSPLRRAILVETAGGYRRGELTLVPGPRLHLEPGEWPRGAAHPAVERARRVPEARRFLVWSRYPVFRVERTAEGTWVHLDDARYTGPGGRSFAGVSVRVQGR